MTLVNDSGTQRPADPARDSALIFGWIALLGAGMPVGLMLLIHFTSDGPEAMAGLLPMFFLLFTGWIWLILAVVALTKASRARRPVFPSVLGWLTIFLLAIAILPMLGSF